MLEEEERTTCIRCTMALVDEYGDSNRSELDADYCYECCCAAEWDEEP